MPSLRVNVAHYKEDLSWIEPIKHKYEVLIYEKNTNLTSYTDYKTVSPDRIALANIGREAHTYLIHIINNYDSLRDYEVFLQGRVDDHVYGNILDHIHAMVEQNRGHISWCHKEKSKIGCFNEEVYHQMKKEYPNHNHINQFYPPHGIRDYLFFKDMFPELDYPTTPYFFNSFALFGVKKEVIRYYPKSFYEKLLEYFNPTYKNFINKPADYFMANMPYSFEAFWDFIFQHALKYTTTS